MRSLHLLNLLVAAPFALALSVLPANASTASYLVSFTASSLYTAVGSGSAPVDPVTGEFTITFDPTLDYNTDTTAGITLDSLNIGLGSTLAFNYSSSGAQLTVGGIADAGGCGPSSTGAGCVQYTPATNDFYLNINGFTTSSPYVYTFGYAQAGANNLYVVGTPGSGFGSASITVGPAATPIPASLPLFASGLCSLGLLFCFKRRTRASLVSASAS